MWKIKKEYQRAFDASCLAFDNNTRIKQFSCGQISVFSLFVWRDTPEGFDFWHSLHKRVKPHCKEGVDKIQEVLSIVCYKETVEDCTWV